MNTTPRSCWSGPARPFHPFGRGLFMLLSALLLALPVPTLAAPGDLDPSFDGDGKVLTDFTFKGRSAFEDISALAVQPDGKVVAAGSLSTVDGSAFALARYNPDGSLDNSFGDGGRVTTTFGERDSISNFLGALVVQPDGKLVVVGGIFNFTLARYNRDGSLDTSFGSNGRVRTSFGDGGAIARAVLVQPDGKLVAAGGVNVLPGFSDSEDFALVRYNRDGSLDASFGAGGIVRIDFGGRDFGGRDSANTLILQPDGKLVAVGGDLIRFNPDGTVDTNFGSGGVAVGDTQANALALQADGKLVTGGAAFFSNNGAPPVPKFALQRFNPDGSLDTSFGTGGIVFTDFGENAWAFGLVLQADGKLVAAGGAFPSTFDAEDFALARYHSDGSLDTSFGTGGLVRTDFAGSFSGARALALQADGKLVAGGGSDASRDLD